jgi:hypothetical protein
MRKFCPSLAPVLSALGVMVGLIAPCARAAHWPTTADRAKAAKALDLGEPAPDWLTQSETYGFSPRPEDWSALAASKVAFVTHCPINREYFARLRALGIRALPYASFYQGFATSTFQGVNLKDHPEFIEVDDKGRLRRTSFWESEDAKNMYTTCPACPEYQDAMCAWVRNVMDLGADGFFVDNLSSRAPCFGAKFGKHKHVSDDANQAFAMLLERVRKIVKEHKPDGVLLGNSASPLALPHIFWKHLDADMLESYVCTWVSKDRWQDWPGHWHEQGVKLHPFVDAGKQVQALSYLGHTPYGVREDAFFYYASARLAGFVWSGGSISDPQTAILYQTRLGPPLGGEQHADGVYYRLFDRGFVALNPEKQKPAVLNLPADVTCSHLVDLFAEGTKPLTDLQSGGRHVTIPPFSGRAYLYASGNEHELDHHGPTLTVGTNPPLGEVRFKVDGFDYWTYSGHWTTEYVLGPDFGKFRVTFDKPGEHTIEIVDVVPAGMQTPAGYGTSQKLGQFMDPAQPTKPANDRKFRFRAWAAAGLGEKRQIKVEVKGNTTVEAKFDVENRVKSK